MMETDTHISVVDELPGNRLALEALLGKHYTVHPIVHGCLALDYLIEGGKADLILLDVVMPEREGLEACRWLKATASKCFDPDESEVLLDIADELRGIAQEYSDAV